MNKYAVVVMILFFLVSCKEDESPTQGEQIGNTLKGIVNENKIEVVDIYVGNFQNHNDAPFTIEGSFIIVNGNGGNTLYYNLTELVTFNLNKSPNGNTLALLFSI